MWTLPLEYMQIRVYENRHSDTGTRTHVNVTAALGFFEEHCPNNNKKNKMSSNIRSLPDPK